MATISADFYIDGINGDDANDGSTAALAKKSIAYFQHANNHLVNAGVTIYIANGTDQNVSEEIGSENRLHFRGDGTADNPITVTNYVPSTGNQTRPKLSNYTDTVAGDWTAIGGGDWTYTLDVNIVNLGSFNKFALLKGSASYDTNSFVTGDLFSVSGTTLTVTSGANDPVTTWSGLRLCYQPVFYQFSDTSAVRGGRVYKNIDCEYAGAFVSGYNTTNSTPMDDNLIENCDISWVGKGIVFKNGATATSTSSFIARRNTISWVAHAAIEAEGPEVINSDISYNTITHANQSSGGSGGVGINGFGNGTTTNNNKVHHNTISDCPHGRAIVTYDGAGIYIETGQIGSEVFANTIRRCHHAIQDNSGEANKVYGNDLSGNDIALIQSDAEARGNVDLTFCDNICDGMTYDTFERDPSATSPLDCILSFQTAGTFTVQNNIMTGAAGTTDNCVRVNTAVAQTRTIENNCINVGGDDIVHTDGTPQAVDASNLQDTDPVLENGRIQSNSPCVGAGVKWWTGANPETTWEPKSDYDTDIGPQSTYSLFHPKNL